MDIAPELLESIQKEFQENISNNKKIQAILKKIEKGTVTYEDAHEYAIEIGNALKDAFIKCVGEDALPDGKLYYNIAERLLNPTLKRNYELITTATKKAQTILNQSKNIHLNAVIPKYDPGKVKGIINLVSKSDSYSLIENEFLSALITYGQMIVDESVRSNADFQYRSGLSPKIIRTSSGHCCEWCSNLVNVYDYYDVSDVGNDVFRRHANCGCKIIYDPGNGKVQDVHTKRWSAKGERENNIKRIVKSNYPKDFSNKNDSNIKTNRNPVEKKSTHSLIRIHNKSVVREYLKKATPGEGKLIFENGYKKSIHKNEIKIADYIHKTLGGDIICLTEPNITGVKSPDYNWNGKLWDLKTKSSLNAVDKGIREGAKQIINNPGGIILDIGNNDLKENDIKKVVENRMYRTKLDALDVITIKNGSIKSIIRYEKR